MLKTIPIIETKGTGCSRLTVRFKTLKLKDQIHHLGDSLGAAIMLVGIEPEVGMLMIRYVNQGGVVLKTISYAREEIIEVMMDESVCEVEGLA